MKWHDKPPVNGRELVDEDVKFSFDRFLTEKGNPERQLLDSVERVEVLDRYTVKFHLKEPFVWLLDVLANAMMMWIIAPEVVEKHGDLKKQEYGAYMATTVQGKFEGMAMGPYALGWEPDRSLYGPYMPDQPRNRGHINDPKLAAMVKEQRRLKEPEARKQLIFDLQRYAAEQQY